MSQRAVYDEDPDDLRGDETQPLNAVEDRSAMLCCQCIPIRLGVFLIAAFAVATGVLSVFGKALGVDTSALFGGYVLQSKVLITFLELSGLGWGFLGMLGAKNCSAGFTQIFLYYQYVRMFSWIGIFYYDLPALWTCETWLTNIANMEWNPRMYNIAMEGQCYSSRLIFLIVACISMCLFGYFTHVNYTFFKMLEEGLEYNIESTKFQNSSAFVSQSLVEKRPLILHPFPTAKHEDPGMLAHAAAWVKDSGLRPAAPDSNQPGFMPRPLSKGQPAAAAGPTMAAQSLWKPTGRKKGGPAAVDAAEP